MKKIKTIFWNVDTQYDFMRNDESFKGSLPIEGARCIEGNLEKLTKIAKERKIKVINTGDWHQPDSKEISKNPDYKTTFPAHCLQETKGAEFVPATKPENPYVIDWQQPSFGKKDKRQIKKRRDIVLYKDNFDVFKGNPYTDEVLKAIKPKRAVVYGVATNVCVDYAVLGLLERGIETYVVVDAIKELPGSPLEEIVEKWREKGAVLTKTKDIPNILK